MLFQELCDKKFGYVNLNVEARRWFLESGQASHPNPLLDPDICRQMVEEMHTRQGIDFSYGGWLEDRSELWRGSYLDENKTHLHLGVDFNVPAGTSVSADHEAEVLYVDTDFPADGGWGNRVIMRLMGKSEILIYAHLDNTVLCKTGDVLSPQDIFAKVGIPPQNGGWFPHLHVQCVEPSYFEKIVAEGLEKLDGYGSIQEIAELALRFKDPMTFVSLT